GSVLSCQSGGALASEPAPEAPRIPSSKSGGPRHFAVPKRAKRKGKMAGQRG
ncbi:unnamed protein product, partial [Ascophyllum nodosum]